MAYFTTADGCKLYYEEYGSGDHLVFIHGWTCNTAFYTAQIEYFSTKYHVVVYDARGHGQSDRGEITERNMDIPRLAADLHELIEGLDMAKDKVNLTGWSMGAATLFAYVRAFGCEYVNKICLIDMAPKVVSDDEWKLGSFTQDEVFKLLTMAAKDWDIASDFFLPRALVKGYDLESEDYRQALSAMQSNTPHAMIFLWISVCSEDFRPMLNQFTVPVLLAYSGNGWLCTPAVGEYLEQNIANSKLVIFSDCGHGLFLDDPDKFNAELDTFLNE
jgi:pimeloyl-ACP methyl ester carboxylesterase